MIIIIMINTDISGLRIFRCKGRERKEINEQSFKSPILICRRLISCRTMFV